MKTKFTAENGITVEAEDSHGNVPLPENAVLSDIRKLIGSISPGASDHEVLTAARDWIANKLEAENFKPSSNPPDDPRFAEVFKRLAELETTIQAARCLQAALCQSRPADSALAAELADARNQARELRVALKAFVDCPDYRGIKTHEMAAARAALAKS